LNICTNFFTDDSLQQSGVHGCVALTEFYLDDNSIKSIDAIVNVCGPLVVLKKLSFVNNPAVKNEQKPRQQFLSFFQEQVIDPDFHLIELNRRPISIDERVNAFVIGQKRAAKGHHRNQGSISLMPTSQPTSAQQPDSALSPSSRGVFGGRKFGTLQSPLQSPASIQSPTSAGGSAGSPALSRRASLLSPANHGLALPVSPYANTSSALANSLMFAAEAARFELVVCSKMKSLDAIQQCRILNLSSLRLMYLHSGDGIGKFTALQRLDLRENDFDILENQGLEHLPNLTALDLRDNNLPSLERVINTLHNCNSLEELYLHRCTRNDETAEIQRYLPQVFSQLKGIRVCDK
jgi:Leucine-rich repeat (LRR) protein